MDIFSPSYKRAKTVKTHRFCPDLKYAVHEFEAEDYIKEGHKVKILPDSLRGNIAKVRNYITEVLSGGNEFLMIDDDIEKFNVWYNVKGEPVAKELNPEEFLEFVEMGFVISRESGCYLWGVNIVGDKGSFREYTPISYSNWVSGSFMGIAKNECRFDETIPLKEDLDYSLQHLNKYRKVLRINSAHMVKKDHGNKGGCADIRTVEKEKEQMQLFIQKWGSKIVKQDTTQRGKKQVQYDINPVIKVPIAGV